jgi:AcrR family transcriptional regulator
VSTPTPSTRERILYEASQLFARQGFHATTTREIARAVGVRQPSLFHHFASKDAILQALLAWDLGVAEPAVRRLARARGPAGVRLYRYVHDDVEHLARAPYNLAGLYTEEVMGSEAFAGWAKKRASLHASVERIVCDGMGSGEFVSMPSALVREAIAGILVRTLMLYSGGRRSSVALGDDVAAFVLRALLTDPNALEEIRRAAADEAQSMPASKGS